MRRSTVGDAMKGRPKTNPPLYIVCAYEPCGKVKEVPNRHLQRRLKHCSHACAARATVAQRLARLREGGRRGGLTTASRSRQRLLARLAGLSPLACFRLGYKTGLESKLRQVRRRFELVPRKAQAA